jgi:hypothetical protein
VNVEGWDDEGTAKEVLGKYNPELVVIMVYGHNPSAALKTPLTFIKEQVGHLTMH